MGKTSLLYAGGTKLTVHLHTSHRCRGICFTANLAQGLTIWTLPTLGTSHTRPTGTQASHLLTVIPHGTPRVTAAGSAATVTISDNATKVPEARLTAITPEASHTWSAGALACGWVTGATVGAMWVAVAGAGTASEAYTLGSSDIVLTTAIGCLGTVGEGHR